MTGDLRDGNFRHKRKEKEILSPVSAGGDFGGVRNEYVGSSRSNVVLLDREGSLDLKTAVGTVIQSIFSFPQPTLPKKMLHTDVQINERIIVRLYCTIRLEFTSELSYGISYRIYCKMIRLITVNSTVTYLYIALSE